MTSPQVRPRQLLRRAAAVVAATLALGCAVALPAAGGAPVAKRVTPTDEPGVTANLWEWNWRSVGRECSVLTQSGFTGVQVAPPQNSLKRLSGDAETATVHPWWEVYQPVSYDLTSRMGTEAQFKSMVKACNKAGVKVYVDAVINHMTGQGSTSYGGVDYTPYDYPDYDPSDFHYKAGECPSSDGGIQDYNNKAQVFRCNLVGLEDLRTQTPKVQAELAGYLNKLLGYGVSGFRVDAGKHVGQDDLLAIYARLNDTNAGTRPYWVLEVFGGGPGVLSPQAFTAAGDVLGLDGGRQIFNAFKSYETNHVGSLATLEVFGTGSGLTSSAKTMSFVTNHDTDRNAGEYLGHKDGATYILANQWLLADGYGSAQVYSSFEWTQAADSPPANAQGLITNTSCTNGRWTCDHRNPGIVAMVGWHNYVGKAKRANWWTDDENVIAFSRGNRGWAGFNNGTVAKQIRVQTGLAKGTYCNVVSGPKVGGSCAGSTVVVNTTGFANVTVGAKSAVAFTKADRV